MVQTTSCIKSLSCSVDLPAARSPKRRVDVGGKPQLAVTTCRHYLKCDLEPEAGLERALVPEKLHELQRLWLIEAARYNVLPIDDDPAHRFNPETAGRPVLIKTQLLFGGMGCLSENCVLNAKNKSHAVTAQIVVPKEGAQT